MNLGEALFASVVLILAVYNARFRKALLWFVVVAVAVAAVGGAGWYGYSRWQAYKEEHPHPVGKLRPLYPSGRFSRIVDVNGGETLRYAGPKEPPDFAPLVFISPGQKLSFACGDDQHVVPARVESLATVGCE
jgi:hypothetical protein